MELTNQRSSKKGQGQATSLPIPDRGEELKEEWGSHSNIGIKPSIIANAILSHYSQQRSAKFFDQVSSISRIDRRAITTHTVKLPKHRKHRHNDREMKAITLTPATGVPPKPPDLLRNMMTVINEDTIEALPQAMIRPFQLRKAGKFPTTRRPSPLPLSSECQEIIDDWVQLSGITIGPLADTLERRAKANRLIYTYRKAFVTDLRDVYPTDIIEHTIDLKPNAVPKVAKGRLYTAKERDYSNKTFPAMVEADILFRMSSEWGAATLFPPKKKGSQDLRTVHNFRPVNAYTIKSQYPMHRLEEVLDTIIKPKFRVFFATDAANGYWAIKMAKGHEYKAGIITPHGQYCYRRMGQGLMGAPHTYSQFTDLVFGPIPKGEGSDQEYPTMIGDLGDQAFSPFMDDHAGSAIDFDAMYDLLSSKYFPRIAFGPVYLSPQKAYFFMSSLEILGFTGSAEGIRPSVKHRTAVMDWREPANREELDGFIWLTPFLRVFIPGRAEHVMILKQAYMAQVPADPVTPKIQPDIEECDQNYTKPLRRSAQPRKPTIRTKWVEKPWQWGDRQRASFQHIKEAITQNAMSGADPELQYHLACDASINALGGILFQIQDSKPGTTISPKHRKNERIIMFMSFRLNDAETRYDTTEREALAVVRCLAEVRWLVIGSPHPTRVYTDHQALQTVMNGAREGHGRLSRWQDRLSEYDIVVQHLSSREPQIGIADGLSRLPTRLTTIHRAEDSERLPFSLCPVLVNQDFNQVSISPAEARALGEEHRTHVNLPEQPQAIAYRPDDPRWEKWATSPWYHRIQAYKRWGMKGLAGLGTREVRAIKYTAKHYSMTGTYPALFYKETDGSLSRCIVETEVPGYLRYAHEDHGHFAENMTMSRIKGQAYWPTRVRDIFLWCKNCSVCQQLGSHRTPRDPRPIQVFQPMSMMAIDFVGPINPACSLTGNTYILIGVDYFSRFMWAKSYRYHTQAEVIDFFACYVVPIFGWPRTVYSDGGSHFTGQDTEAMLTQHNVQHLIGPVSHPQSTGLAERAVQMMVSYVRHKCVEVGNTQGWSRWTHSGAIAINTRYIQQHGHTPSMIMLGYSPRLFYLQDDIDQNPSWLTSNNEVPRGIVDLRIALVLEDRLRAINRRAVTMDRSAGEHKPTGFKKGRSIEEGDLVMVWDHRQEKNLGNKLRPRWMGPRLVDSVNQSRTSVMIKELHGNTIRKYHINDVKAYFHRDNIFDSNDQGNPVIRPGALEIRRYANAYAGYPGQRAFDLASY